MTAITLPYLAAARFSGDDAAEFLQAQLSADVLALAVGQATFACYCTPRGQVLGLLLVCRQPSGWIVIGATELLPGILQRLRMFVLRSRVEFDLLTEQSVTGFAGDAAPAETFPAGETGLLYGLGPEANSNPSRVDAWKHEELAKGVVWLDDATKESYIPQMLGFDEIGAVSFNKGCYPGQEIVARTRYLGRVKRTPLLLETEPGFAAPNGSAVKVLSNGEWTKAALVDSVATENGKPLLFLVSRLEPGSAVEELEFDGKRYGCATT